MVPRAAFFAPDGSSLDPAPIARSPWGARLHGRLVGGLCARAAEDELRRDPELVCARLTVDLFRAGDLAPLEVTSRQVRRGGRITVLEVTVQQRERPVGRGSVVLLRRGRQPSGEFVSPQPWTMPKPSGLGAPTERPPSANGYVAPWDLWAREPLRGGAIRGDVWIRDRFDLVAGEPITPLIRMAMAADLASPVVHTSTNGLGFINADYTLYLMRAPVGEHMGVERSAHLSHHGVGVGACVVHDEAGPVGFVTTAAVAEAPRGLAPRSTAATQELAAG